MYELNRIHYLFISKKKYSQRQKISQRKINSATPRMRYVAAARAANMPRQTNFALPILELVKRSHGEREKRRANRRNAERRSRGENEVQEPNENHLMRLFNFICCLLYHFRYSLGSFVQVVSTRRPILAPSERELFRLSIFAPFSGFLFAFY